MTKWEYKVVEERHHNTVPKTIEKLEEEGWELMSYSVATPSVAGLINHYLLFRREKV